MTNTWPLSTEDGGSDHCLIGGRCRATVPAGRCVGMRLSAQPFSHKTTFWCTKRGGEQQLFISFKYVKSDVV